MKCTLCLTDLILQLDDRHYQCHTCKAILKKTECYPAREVEKAHYLTHNNDVNDPRYQQFASPITNHVTAHFNVSHLGLDFGSGTGPVISDVLQKIDYTITQYDPYFANYPDRLHTQYDYICCCEVIEHFHDPKKEFDRLRQMLTSGGQLICMTHLYTPDIDFDSWYYKNDPTHVFMYSPETIAFIATQFGFSAHMIANRLVVFETITPAK